VLSNIIYSAYDSKNLVYTSTHLSCTSTQYSLRHPQRTRNPRTQINPTTEMEVKKLNALLTLVGLTFAVPTDFDHNSLLAGQDSNHARSALDLTALEQNLTLSRQPPPLVSTTMHSPQSLHSRRYGDIVLTYQFQQLCIPIKTQPWDVANQLTILSGISYLRNVGVPCNTGPGPGNCVRVSCSYDAAIYLCNDVNILIYHISDHYADDTTESQFLTLYRL
jgi:hypothetical protein